MQRHRNRSSDAVRALRRQADREKKRAVRQQATESQRSQRSLVPRLLFTGGREKCGLEARLVSACLCARPHLRMCISSKYVYQTLS